jgi:hypothetical protein
MPRMENEVKMSYLGICPDWEESDLDRPGKQVLRRRSFRPALALFLATLS